MGVRRPSPHQSRPQLGARRRDPHTDRNRALDGAPGRPAESSHPQNRTKQHVPEHFLYKPAFGSSLPNRTSELRLRKPPCDENAMRSKESLHRPQIDQAMDLRMTSTRPRVQVLSARDGQPQRSPQAQHGTRDSPAGLKLAPRNDYSAERNTFQQSAEKYGSEYHSHVSSRSDSGSGNDYDYPTSRPSGLEDTANTSSHIHSMVRNPFNQSNAPTGPIHAVDRSSVMSPREFPIDQMEYGTDIQSRVADAGGGKRGAEGNNFRGLQKKSPFAGLKGLKELTLRSNSFAYAMPANRETKDSNRSAPSSKSGLRKRQFISPSSSHFASSSTKTQEEAASINDLLSVVGEKNKNLVEDLDHAVKENQSLRAQIDVSETERRRSRESLKELTSKILTGKAKLDENFSEMKFQVRDRFALEKRQSELSSQEIGCLRKEIHESLEAFRSLHEKSSIQDDEIAEPEGLRSSFQDARKAINVAKEVDEDRKKKQMVIEILRKEASKSRIYLLEISRYEVELENFSGHQSIHMAQMEESWREKSQNIQTTVQKRTELILGRLDEKYCLEEEQLHTKIQTLERRIASQNQVFTELSKELEASKLKLEQAERSLDTERQDNAKHRQESSNLNNNLSRAEAQRCHLEELTTRLAKENFKLEESKSKIDADKMSLKNQYVALSEELCRHQNLLNRANQDADSLNVRLRDQESVICGLQACEAANKSSNLELVVLKQQIDQIEQKNLALANQKACTNLHVSECHLKIENLESKQEEMMHISTQDSDSARQLYRETLVLKETIQKAGADLDDMRRENSLIRKDISSKEDQLLIAAGSEAQLKEKVEGLLAGAEQLGNTNKELQSRLDCTQDKWEDSRSRENVLTGQAHVLRENLNEAHATQNVLNYEINKLQEQVADLGVKNSEAQMAGELRHSMEAINRLNETVSQQIQKREEFDQLQNARLESEKRYISMLEESKGLNALVEKHEKEEASLQESLKATKEELERSKIEMMDLKTSHAAQVSTAAEILHETEKQASESRKQAVYFPGVRGKGEGGGYFRAQVRNCNEKKRLAKQLGDSESRLLAISAELAKSKGKPSLEEIFSSSEYNDQMSRPSAPKTDESSSTRKRRGDDEKKPTKGKKSKSNSTLTKKKA
ncbi:hypothetical protein PTTG_25148 [Puccinia triticina 1-1 BBBD Race 1]|uniref:Uncharacterized protein n=2 Tax=Puccinia triticina TaxID=208348 RepID=A0A180H4Z6_PUCT1|nr:uncharacterized protein PtA15_9A222 [Puccinia triticina]OAW00036.1 hypothetical protein PTTG_25148 [Puccinia triticina 1-1 BBBD Race 1]WAQ88097.1 hypothetical protein PtA15_9A222 [Puccinia triticina]WAR60286.1 hypothetical protein PtB15_9B223 [Puccinia triticina]